VYGAVFVFNHVCEARRHGFDGEIRIRQVRVPFAREIRAVTVAAQATVPSPTTRANKIMRYIVLVLAIPESGMGTLGKRESM